MGHKHKFDPAHVDKLLSNERMKKLEPDVLLTEAGLSPRQVFADIGCGPGFFSFEAAQIVGLHGKVLAIDSEPAMLDALKEQNPPVNLSPILSEENKIPVDDAVVDFALVAFVLHETLDEIEFLKEVKRILKPNAKLVIVDWKKQEEEHGPPMADRLTEAEVSEKLTKAGFSDITSSELNSSHYRIIARI